jgi:hypothetical protein
MLSVCVGEAVCDTPPKERTYYVHQNLITARSEYFKRATNGKWQESDERTVNLREDVPDIFEIYLNLLYTGTLATKKPLFGRTDADNEYTILAQVYVLAEKLQDTEAKNSVSEAILLLTRELTTPWSRVPINAVEVIYDGTPDSSQARRLFVDLFADHGGDDWLPAEADIPHDFLYDLSIRLFKQRGHSGAKTTIICPLSAYHQTNSVPLTSK